MGRLKREHARVARKGWSPWKRAMVPESGSKRSDVFYNKRSRNRPGYWCKHIANVFDNKGYNCGIYEWQARDTTEGADPSRKVVYIGSTCRAKPGALQKRIMEYCKDGSHKSRLINRALRNEYELWVRVKTTNDRIGAEDEENEFLRKYNYAWNKRNNGNRIRHVLR